MKKVLSLFIVQCSLFIGAGFANDYTYNTQTVRAGLTPAAPKVQAAVQTAEYRAPTIPTPNFPGGTMPNPINPTPTYPTTPDYLVEDCMKDLLTCVNGTLPDGIASLYNADMRNSVINGMNLCAAVVDKCLNSARRLDGNKAYYVRNNVWADFNSREIQPQYYTHVMYKTGLTPNQAENTCWLLDRNTYGAAFTAVNAKGVVTNEYNQGVNAYNNQGGGKGNPMGQMVNNRGAVDAQRGHYARWDATAGECLVRVAAYNKDELITDKSFFFGEFGGKQTAEKWVRTGTAFSCKMDFFGFNLMRDTQNIAINTGTAAVVTTGGITAIAAGAAKEKYKLDEKNCGDKEFVKILDKAIADLNGDSVKDKSCLCKLAGYGVVPGSGDDCGKVEGYDRTALDAAFDSHNNKGKGAAAGTAVAIAGGITFGAAALATGIAAFVEKNNITCRIGDGLETVGLGKSGRVKSLKDYYVEWALNLPDTVLPQQTVIDCPSWNLACNSITNIYDCTQAAVTYLPAGSTTSTMVNTACDVSGSTCVANDPIAISYGACP